MNDSPSLVQALTLLALYDDGYVLYLNGEEIFRSASMPGGAINHDTPARTSYNSIGYEAIDLRAHTSRLRLGKNILAVEVHQESAESTDLSWDASLIYQLSGSPAVGTPVITPPGGTFQAAVTVSITASPSDAELFYTLNGADPDPASLRYSGPLPISSATTLKARAYKPDYNQSGVALAQFAFVNSDADGDGMPDSWESIYFGDPLAGVPNGDPDADGLSNLHEFLAGTDPTNPASTLRIVRIAGESLQAGLIIEWTSAAGAVYQIERASSLGSTTQGFAIVASDVSATSPLNSFSVQPTSGPAFYRIRIQR